MLSNKEKKAIELLKDFKIELNNVESYQRPDVEGKYKKILIVLQEENFDTFQTILDLLEKQQKEIERLKQVEQAHQEENGKLRVELEKEKQYSDFYKDLCDKQQEEIEDLKKDNNHQWEERCKLTFELEKEKNKIREILKDLDEFDTNFYNIDTLKLAIKNTLQELLEVK